MSYRALGDVPTVDVNPLFLVPPSPTSVTDLQLDAAAARGVSLGTVLAVGAAVLAYSLIRGQR